MIYYYLQRFENQTPILNKNIKLDIEFNGITNNLELISFMYKNKIIFSIIPFFNSNHYYITANYDLFRLASELFYYFDFFSLKKVENSKEDILIELSSKKVLKKKVTKLKFKDSLIYEIKTNFGKISISFSYYPSIKILLKIFRFLISEKY